MYHFVITLIFWAKNSKLFFTFVKLDLNSVILIKNMYTALVNFGLIVLVKCWPTSFLQLLHDDLQTGSNNHVSGYQNGISFYLIIFSFLSFCISTCLSICARKKYSNYYSQNELKFWVHINCFCCALSSCQSFLFLKIFWKSYMILIVTVALNTV